MSTPAFRQGEHVCSLHETEDEQRTFAAEYLADGLFRGERCFYVGRSREALERFHQSLGHVGVDALAMIESGALVESTAHQAHVLGGRFECDRMLRVVSDALQTALDEGFSGLRTCGDMSWLLTDAPGCAQLPEYESRLNRFFPHSCAIGMCQYNLSELPASWIDHALATHPTVVIQRQRKTNIFYKPPPIAATRVAQPADVPWKLTELLRR